MLEGYGVEEEEKQREAARVQLKVG